MLNVYVRDLKPGVVWVLAPRWPIIVLLLGVYRVKEPYEWHAIHGEIPKGLQ